jgi:hypothetical protein
MSLEDSGFHITRAQAARLGETARPRFHKYAKKMTRLSAEAGRDVYEDRHYVEIIQPGEMRSVVDREVNEDDKRRWPREWAAYEAGNEMATVGTPLEKWPLIGSPAMVKTLKAININTVEDLACLTDAGLGNVGMGARNLRESAKLWLSEAKDKGAAILQALENNEAKDARIASLEAEVARLGGLIEGGGKCKTLKLATADE